MAKKGTPRRKLKLDPRRCPHIKANGEQCGNVAGKGTSHVGAPGSKCHKHHGNNGPLKHGLFPKYAKGSLADRLEELIADPKLTDLVEVIAVQSALLTRHFEKAHRSQKAMVATLKVSEALVTSIEKYHKITYGEKQVIRIESMKGVADEIVDIIMEFVPDKKKHPIILKRIEHRILGATYGSSALH